MEQIQWQIQWQKLAKTHHTKPLCNGLEASHVQYNSESHLAHMQSYVPAASPLIIACHHSSGSQLVCFRFVAVAAVAEKCQSG